jgi:CRISPR-associated endonuclease Cas3-HD
VRDLIARWPGKSAAPGEGIAHPALYHMLDVAAVAERLAAPFGFPEPLRQALVLLAALHDLGKIGDDFRRMLTDGRPQPFGRHWELTEAWLHALDPTFGAALGGTWQRRQQLYAATAGHHGRPPCRARDDFPPMRRRAGAQAAADVAVVAAAFRDLWPGASLADLDREAALRLSWWLPGLVAAADWIGSNADWFPACPPGPDPAAYLARVRPQARHAVAAAGLDTPSAADRPLFDFPLRPMQQACSTIALCDGPMLAVIEDETGAGKTEAALILAQRMMLAGKGRGLFFALPTMATADAMFARARAAVARPTRTSETGAKVWPQEAHPAEAFFGMLRRLRLLGEAAVTGVIQRPHGTDYAGWVHPLTPCYRLKAGAELLPVHPRAGVFGYRNWLGVAAAAPGGGLRLRARTVDDWQGCSRAAASVLVAGWAMDNMKPRDFILSETPVLNRALPGLADRAAQQRRDEKGKPSRLKSSSTFKSRNCRPSARRSAMKSIDQARLGASSQSESPRTSCRENPTFAPL